MNTLRHFLRKRCWLNARTPIDSGPYALGIRLFKRTRWLPGRYSRDHWLVRWLGLYPEY